MRLQLRRSSLSVAVLSTMMAAAFSQEAEPKPGPRTVAIIVHDDVELLDFAGPGEVFAAAGFKVVTVASTVDPIIGQKFLKIVPNHSISDCPRPDILVIPGGDTARITEDARMMAWIKATSSHAEITMTVCTGAFALARQGLLDGQRATTHWSAINGLKREAPTAKVEENVRFVDNGRVITTAGVSAGIDGALHVVSRLLGERAAWQTARYMEYNWEPPAPSNASEQQVAKRQAMRHVVYREWEVAIEAYQKLLAESPDDAESHFGLGLALNEAGRYREAMEPLGRAKDLGKADRETYSQLGRAQIHAGKPAESIDNMVQAIELGDSNGITFYNLACAYSLTGNVADAVESLRGAFNNGFDRTTIALTDPDLTALHTNAGFKALIREYHASNSTQLVTEKEPGEPLVVAGTVRDSDGAPVRNAIVYVFHADQKGEYTTTAAMDEPNARIFGYLRTSSDGRYEFRTVRPGGYRKPVRLNGEDRLLPAHIHFEVGAPGYRDEKFQMVFDDDPRMDDHWRNNWAPQTGSPIVQVHRGQDGSARCEHDIVLKKE